MNLPVSTAKVPLATKVPWKKEEGGVGGRKGGEGQEGEGGTQRANPQEKDAKQQSNDCPESQINFTQEQAETYLLVSLLVLGQVRVGEVAEDGGGLGDAQLVQTQGRDGGGGKATVCVVERVVIWGEKKKGQCLEL